MNGTYYQNPTFPGNTNSYDGNVVPPGNISNYDTNMNNQATSNNTLPMEQSYIENILRLNKGKIVKAYVSFPDSTEWKNKVYEGRIEQAGRDHLIISNPTNGEWYLILMIYLNYVTFTEPINYSVKYS
jgi:spore germination protein Q